MTVSLERYPVAQDCTRQQPRIAVTFNVFEYELMERRKGSGLKDSGLMDTETGIPHVAQGWKAACGREHRAWVEV